MRRPDCDDEMVKLDTMSTTKIMGSAWLALMLTLVAVAFSTLGPQADVHKPADGNAGVGIDLVNNGWAHSFFFENLYSNHVSLSFRIDVNKLSRAQFQTSFSAEIPISLLLRGVDEDGNEEVTFNGTLPRAVTCDRRGGLLMGTVVCSEVLVFHESYVAFKKFTFLVSVPPEARRDLNFISSVDFFFTYESQQYARWEIRLNYLCFGLSLLGTLWWFYVCKVGRALYAAAFEDKEDEVTTDRLSGATRCLPACSCCCRGSTGGCLPYRTGTQQWVAVLLVLLTAYNQPLYAFQYLPHPGWRAFFVIVSASLQLAFASVLSIFWLGTFSSLYTIGRGSQAWWLAKLVFGLTFWVVGSVLYAQIILLKVTDRTLDWWNDLELMAPVSSFLAIYGLAFFAWITFLVLRGAGEWGRMRAKHKALYVFHLVHLLIFVAGSVSGAVFAEDVRHSRLTFFFQFALTFYVLELAYLMKPALARPTRFHDDADGLGVQNGVSMQFEISAVAPRTQANNEQAVTKTVDTTSINLAMV